MTTAFISKRTKTCSYHLTFQDGMLFMQIGENEDKHPYMIL